MPLLRRLGGRPAGRRLFSTKHEESKAKSMFEHIMENRMPVSLGVCCLVAVELRRRFNDARKQQALDAEAGK